MRRCFFSVCIPENLVLTRHPTPSVGKSEIRSSVQWPVGGEHVIVGDVDRFYITSGRGGGGYLPSDIVWRYTASTSSWKSILTTGDPPPQLRSACAVEFAGRIFLHGGVGGGVGGPVNDDLFIYNITENQWRKVGDGGNGRMGAICFGDKKTKKIHVFGGRNELRDELRNEPNELHTYHDGAWQKETNFTGPSARYGMAATTVGEAVFLHGGFGQKCEGVSVRNY
jgi:N-acetylneuraminic acid mutarotase